MEGLCRQGPLLLARNFWFTFSQNGCTAVHAAAKRGDVKSLRELIENKADVTKLEVNGLDKLPIYSNGGYRPKVIVRTAVASNKPLDPQAQHLGNFTDPYRQMLKTVDVIELTGAHQVFDAYRKAYEREDGRSTLLVEHTSRYA